MVAWRNQWRVVPECVTPSDGQTQQVTQGDLPITLADALFHCRIDAGTEDDLVTSLIRSVQGELEPPTGWLGRALTTSTYKLVIPYFARRIRLAGAPIQSVDSITYRDVDGNVQTVDETLYRLTDDAIPSVVLTANSEWPTDVIMEHDAVTVNYTAGYGTEADVPEIIKQYIRVMVAYRYDVRKPTAIGTIVTPNPYIRDMLESLRVHL